MADDRESSGTDARIRAEEARDREAVHRVHAAAFPTPFEADLVDVLRERADPIVSLVAERDGAVVGHVLFTPVTLAGHPDLALMGLAPMAVRPEHQRSGVGSALVRAGLERCVRGGFDGAVVLGHAEYYPRFGFVPASRFGIDSAYDVPDDVFMARELRPGALQGRGGRIAYHAAFGGG